MYMSSEKQLKVLRKIYSLYKVTDKSSMVFWLKQNNMYSYDVRVCISTKNPYELCQTPSLRKQALQFFKLLFGCPRSTLDYYRGDSLTYLMLITAFLQFWPKGNWEPHYEIGSLSLDRCLVGFELGIFQLFQ